MNFTVMTITPSMAKSILENNFKNRRVDPRRVDQYASDMLNGKWKTNTGETIKITKSGKFADGQHRLHAVIKANVPIEFEVRTGVNDDAIDVIDTGKSRSTSDIFYMSTIKNGAVISSFLNNYFNLIKGNTAKSTYNKTPSHDILSYYNENPNLYQLIGNQTVSWYSAFGKILSTSMIGGFYLFFKDVDESDAQRFMNQLCTGADVSNKTILLLRTRLIADKTSRVTKMPGKLKAALIIKTWNYFRQNRNMSTLHFIESTETFPKPL